MTETSALVAINARWAGLGNRMRFTLSAQAVAAAEGREFSYTWPTSEAFEPALTDLWNFMRARPDPWAIKPELTEKDDLTQLRTLATWAIRSEGVVRGDGSERPWEELFRELVPAAAIRRKIAVMRVRLRGRTYVGVQIRASEKSHERTLEASPVSWFVERMREMAHEEPRTIFFLSCDTPDAQAHVLREVPRTFAFRVDEGYNTTAAVRKSIADLYVLAESRYILGPHWSSFVQLAWALSGRRQPLETSRNLYLPGS